jgi:hypothetical protein
MEQLRTLPLNVTTDPFVFTSISAYLDRIVARILDLPCVFRDRRALEPSGPRHAFVEPARLLENARRANVPRDRRTGCLRARLAIMGFP